MEKSYVLVYKRDIEAALMRNNITNYVILNDRLCVIYVPEDFDENILVNTPEVSWWDIEVPMSDMIELSANSQGQTVSNAIGSDYFSINPYINSTGEGVIIAILGSGIDYMHPDFMFDDGSTKIVSIWDQEKNSKSPPEGMIYGSEFNRDDINAAIKNVDLDLTSDNLGKGTIAAGVSSGTGRLNSNNKGVATGSELIAVKLRENNGIYKEGRISYRSTDFLCGIRYVLDMAKKENKKLIINLKIGERSRVSILTNYLDTFAEIRGEGVIVVSAAGNEGNTDTHFQGTLSSNQELQDVAIQVGQQKSLKITMSTDGPGRAAVAVISPSGEISRIAYYSPEYYLYKGKFNLENAEYEIRYIYPWLLTGKAEVIINIYDIKPGVWTLRIIPELYVTGVYDVFLPNKTLIAEETRFLQPDPNSTITLYGTTSTTITVGAFNGRTDNLWIGSSRGPTRGKSLKPDIVAPGVNITSTFINQTYTTATGTGVSSSLVCGVLALIIEYLSQLDNLNRKILYTEVLKSYLMIGARRQSIYTYPNYLQGYGILDLRNTISTIANYL